MKRILQTLIILSFLAALPMTLHSQCKSFAKKICKLELIPYIHDGNYHAAILTEGEEAELYKTFYAGQEYRIAICGSDALPDVDFQISDANRNVLYSNKDHDYARTWDFKLESSQQLKIAIKVPSRGKSQSDAASGCVAIMFGFKNK
jgi:hypothetical protein